MIPDEMRNCARCGKGGEGRPVAAAIKIPASVALAFMHGGMWVHEELSRPYCARCRRIVSTIALGAALLILSAAAFGVGLWLSRPRR